MFWIDDRRVDVGENAKFICDANVVAIRRNAVTDHAFADLAVGKRLDHLVFERHAANPLIRLDGHHFSLRVLWREKLQLRCCVREPIYGDELSLREEESV